MGVHGITGSLSLPLVFLFLVSSSLPSLTISASSSVRCHPDDKTALLKIKQSFTSKFPSDVTPWDPNTDCCDWGYVQCDDQTNRVNVLNIFNTGMDRIPEAIGDLPYLEILQLQRVTKISGSIPYSITKLQNLKIIRMWRINLSGSIPEFLTQLKNLESLDLSYNRLSGPIPASLANLQKLRYLYLDWNKLTGRIPDSFGRFNTTGGFSLDLSNNLLSGEVPASLAEFNYVSIDLSYNKLVGDVSVLLRENGAAQNVYLSNNLFDFDLSKVRFPKNLSFLKLSHNRIRGSIPEQITELPSLQVFDVSYNRLCGRIPVGGNVQNIAVGYFIHNKCLCGPPLPNQCK
ncbi:PREDICTED: polygalacturonase inhibitor-like [Nelumbo nucifera]|uniref:Polygalacturonase inhibitor-like n=2 Tax=Nelumbo nucifera TaxID=4432 RepID=A0A1U8ASY8_NELNU|nr:PREDICTED: polygalacturonase inhibitor-like [Nelumbo nucifera]DAD29925.1 TPA_asm: hypothetical protein HUJ06_031393 [Nelumbo nucifera]